MHSEIERISSEFNKLINAMHTEADKTDFCPVRIKRQLDEFYENEQIRNDEIWKTAGTIIKGMTTMAGNFNKASNAVVEDFINGKTSATSCIDSLKDSALAVNSLYSTIVELLETMVKLCA